MGAHRFVSLTTFRKTGVAVSTPVWIATDGEAMLVTTPTESGKVKRLRNNSRVEIRPCGRLGNVADDAPTVVGHAEIVADTDQRLTGVIRRKYGLEYHAIMGIEHVLARRRKPRVILRITPAT